MRWWRPQVRVRRLLAEDAEPWRALRLEALRLHPEAFGSTHDEWAGQPLSVFVDRLNRAVILGAFFRGDLVGSMALDAEGETGEITAVYIRPDQRGRGLARRLMARVLRIAKQAGLRRLTLTVAETNHPALRFYLAAGFRRQARAARALSRDGRLLDLITLSRDL
ncbi:GNAT family N-acetyltransferase [Nioella nitratireducens]|uniref:GNAT family N-acetyltransferase n=1 Tax=Nioella nitratireducens TaxID=1287720 RepID=UPI0008FD77C2|nr:GNAT family N-acetyltransferase [Nioella nitratireducens]